MGHESIEIISEQLQEINLDCDEYISNYSDMSDDWDDDTWMYHLSEDGRHTFLSNNMTVEEFEYRRTTSWPEAYVYYENEIHMYTNYLTFDIKNMPRLFIHMNSGCMDMFEQSEFPKTWLTARESCAWFPNATDMVRYIANYKREHFCAACDCFLYFYADYQTNPCQKCEDAQYQFG
jgi:hypothetical protein